MNFKYSLLAALIAVAGLSACGGGGSSTDSTPPNELEWVRVVYQGPTVLTKADVVVGTGAEAVAGKRVSVKLTEWRYNATAPAFKGDTYVRVPMTNPYAFTLAITSAPDLADAVLGMKVGGKRSAVIPGDMRDGIWIDKRAAFPVLRPASVAEIELVAVE